MRFIFLLLVILFVSCRDSEFRESRIRVNDSTVIIIKTKRGTIVEVGEYKRIGDGIYRNGIYQTYYDNGLTRDLYYFKNGMQDSLGLHYYPNGRLKSKVFMEKGQFSGLQYQYYPSGLIKEVTSNINDSVIYFMCHYSQDGVVDTLVGTPVRILPNKTKGIKLSDTIGIVNEIAILPNTRTDLIVQTSINNIVIYDTAISQFYYSNRQNVYYLPYYLKIDKPGKYSYKCKILIFDSATNRAIYSTIRSRAFLIPVDSVGYMVE